MARAQNPATEGVEKLSKDLLSVTKVLGRSEAKYLVDAYYKVQEDRMRIARQAALLEEQKLPTDLLDWMLKNNLTFESQLRKALGVFSMSQPLGKWARGQHGIGPVIAAGLLANINFETTPAISNLWSFAGLNPTAVWNRGEKRPWNATLKVLCWNMGESFMKHGRHPKCIYGHLLYQRLEIERSMNVEGLFAKQAKEVLAKKRIGKDTEAYLWYSGSLRRGVTEGWSELTLGQKEKRLIKTFRVPEGTGVHMLPPAHILGRAKRYAVKIFLAHYYTKGCEILGKPSPTAYVQAKWPELHSKLLPVPNDQGVIERNIS